MLQTEYERDEEDYRNYAFVAGAGEGNDRVIVEVDQREGTASGQSMWTLGISSRKRERTLTAL